jgi:hypothetical protein
MITTLTAVKYLGKIQKYQMREISVQKLGLQAVKTAFIQK